MSEPADTTTNPETPSPRSEDPIQATIGFSQQAARDPSGLPAIPGYEVLDELGRGGMGVVYRARQANLNRVVALKMMLQGTQASEDDTYRFRTEAEAIAHLSHPNIVHIHEIGQWSPPGGGPTRAFFSMEYCAGGTLEGRLSGGPLQPVEAARLLAVLASAIQVAHQKGIIHRDLKPANVLYKEEEERTPERPSGSPVKPPSGTPGPAGTDSSSPREAFPASAVKITDFGLAKRLDGSGVAQTASGAVIGTPAYMAPEQACGKPAAAAADIYALGAVLYECLTGRPPFLGATMGEVLLQVMSNEPVPPGRLLPRLSRDLETICLKCLEKDPARRYGNAQALADDLHRFLNGEPIVARPISAAARLGRWAGRNPVVATLLALVAAQLAGTAILATAQAFLFDQERRKVEMVLVDRVEALGNLQLALEEQKKATEEAELALEQAVEREEQEARERARAETASYIGLVGLAERYWSANQVELAERKLDLCPPRLRRWEWRFLEALCSAELLTVQGPTGQTGRSVLTRDGRRVASVCERGVPGFWGTGFQIVLWDGSTGSSRFGLLEDTLLSPPSLAMHPEGKFLAVAHANKTIALYDISGKVAPEGPVHLLRGLEHAASALVFAPDGNTLLATCQEGKDTFSIRKWSVAGGKLLTTRKRMGNVRSLAVSAAGRVAIGLDSGVVTLDDPGLEDTGPLWIRERHHRPILSLAFSPDGKRLLSGGEDGTARLWDSESGKESLVVTHGGAIAAVGFNPTGTRIVTDGEDRAVVVWDAVTGREQFTVRGQQAGVRALVYLADGKELAVLDRQGTLKTWDARTGRVGQRLTGGLSGVLALKPDGKQVAVADGSTVRFHAVDTGASLGVLDIGQNKQIRQVAYTSAGSRLVTVSTLPPMGKPPLLEVPCEVALRDLASGQVLFTQNKMLDPAQLVAISSDGRWAGVLGFREPVHVWDLQANPVREWDWPAEVKNPGAMAIAPDGRVAIAEGVAGQLVILSPSGKGKPRTLFGHQARIQSLAFGPPGTEWLASGGADRTVHLWNLKATGKGPVDQPVLTSESPMIFRGHSGAVTGLAFSPDGERLASVGGELKLWGLPGGEEVLTWPTPGRTVLFGPAGRHLAVATHTDTIHLWDSAPTRDTLLLREAGSALAFLPDGKQVALAGRDQGVDLWNLERRRPAARLPGQNRGYAPGHARTVRCLATSRDGRWMATGGDDGSLRLWDLSTRQVRHSLVGHRARVTGLAFSPDGALLASSSMDETVRIQEVATGRWLTTWARHDERVLCVAFSPDGQAVASGGEDGKVYLWEPRTGKPLAEPLLHPEPVNAVRFQPGGRLLATAGEDSLIRLWDAGTGRLVRTLTGHEDSVRDLAFRPDGQRLASAGWDHLVKVWDVSRGTVVTTLRGHDEGLTAVAFSPDGKQLAAADESLEVQVWAVAE